MIQPSENLIRKYLDSRDYKERMIGEYWSVKVRYDRLHLMIVKREAGKLDFEPSCPLELWQEQAAAMGQYLHILEIRAQIEGIDLESILYPATAKN